MKVSDLITFLSKLDPDIEAVLWDEIDQDMEPDDFDLEKVFMVRLIVEDGSNSAADDEDDSD